jgi:hypothetical protein
MPDFNEITTFLKDIGMPWSVAVGVGYIHYKTLSEISGLQQKMCATLEILTGHVIKEKKND